MCILLPLFNFERNFRDKSFAIMIPANHSHAPWRKAVLVLFWVVQLLLELVMIALLALAVGVLVTYSDDYDYDDNVERAGKMYEPPPSPRHSLPEQSLTLQ